MINKESYQYGFAQSIVSTDSRLSKWIERRKEFLEYFARGSKFGFYVPAGLDFDTRMAMEADLFHSQITDHYKTYLKQCVEDRLKLIRGEAGFLWMQDPVQPAALRAGILTEISGDISNIGIYDYEKRANLERDMLVFEFQNIDTMPNLRSRDSRRRFLNGWARDYCGTYGREHPYQGNNVGQFERPAVNRLWLNRSIQLN